MNTYNGALTVRIRGDITYVRVHDCDFDTVATAELTAGEVKTLRTELDEALIQIQYPDKYIGRENGILEQP